MRHADQASRSASLAAPVVHFGGAAFLSDWLLLCEDAASLWLSACSLWWRF
jgi:hypothetical protein